WRASTADGHFVVAAIDHRTNLLEKLNAAVDGEYDDAAFKAFKFDVISALASHSSGILTDPAFGITPGLMEKARGIGILAPVEVTDYGLHPSERDMAFIPDWSVAKIKRVGGDGVKLLLPYHPDDAKTEERHAVVRLIVEACTQNDIPFFLEPIPYSPDPMVKLTNEERLEISVGMCETFTDMGADVLKLPFPVDASQSRDLDEWAAACSAIDGACGVPWALLSAGVDFDTFLLQAEVACKAGASGVIVGRAVWGEAVGKTDDELFAFLYDVAAPRMKALRNVCAAYATPWTQRVESPEMSVDWYETYSG
ncbi:MAG: tagatose 1,6-diphosphate aldolase, partial [Chloroflexota bacterium]